MGCCSSSEVSCCLVVVFVAFKLVIHTEDSLGQRGSRRHFSSCSSSWFYNNNNNNKKKEKSVCWILGAKQRADTAPQHKGSLSIIFPHIFLYALAGQTWLETAGGSQLHGHTMAHHILAVLYRDGKFPGQYTQRSHFKTCHMPGSWGWCVVFYKIWFNFV